MEGGGSPGGFEMTGMTIKISVSSHPPPLVREKTLKPQFRAPGK